ncbi:ABC transporter transmembrane domain-containing protein, partial [Winogradskyella ouciana]|uniref:ABC transporter transmembrane domain-containing protein n=1 Tax=Winogradskyella ouciana TaxID=2608631 RepID=UPI003D272480
MNYFRQILGFAKPYKGYAILNIVCNIFYALFGTLSMVSLFPMLNVLFGKTEPLMVKPEWTGLSNIKDYGENYLNYFVTQKSIEGHDDVLIFMVGLVITMFLLKNIFAYLAMYFITFLRNGVLRDIRNKLYEKIMVLPVSYYSEKRKGDTIARISSDVQEIQSSFLSILELIVREPLMIIFTIIMMVLISIELTIFVFIFIP